MEELFEAVWDRDYSKVKELLEKGIDPNQIDELGHTVYGNYNGLRLERMKLRKRLMKKL